MAVGGSYARRTSVSTDRSVAELQRLLKRYGATEFAFADQPERALVQFRREARTVRFFIPLPTFADFLRSPTGRIRTAPSQRMEYDKACRQRWRAIVLLVRAKLEAIAIGAVGFDEAFLPNLLLPDARTVTEWASPFVYAALERGTALPQLEGAVGVSTR